MPGHKIIPCFLNREAIEETPAHGHNSADDDPDYEKFYDLLSIGGYEKPVGLCGNGKLIKGLRHVVARDRPEEGLEGYKHSTTVLEWEHISIVKVPVRRVLKFPGLQAGLNPT